MFNLNLKLPPTRKPYNPGIPTPPKGIKPPGGFTLGIVGGVLSLILDDLASPSPTARDALDEIDQAFLEPYKPRPPVEVEPGVPAGFFGGQSTTQYYKAVFEVKSRSGATSTEISGTSYLGKCVPGEPYMNQIYGYTDSGEPYGTIIAPFTVESGATTVNQQFPFSYVSAKVIGFQVWNGAPDTGGDPPGTPPVVEQGTANPVPDVSTEPPYTNEEFFQRYGYPPRLKPVPKPAPPPSKKKEEEKAPFEFPEFFPDTPVFDFPEKPPFPDPSRPSVKPGNAPDKLTKTYVKPGASSNTTTRYLPPKKEDRIILLEPYTTPTKPNSPQSPSPVPEVPISKDFEEETRKTLEKIYKQTTEEEQKKYTETAICNSYKKPDGCSKPVLDKLEELLEDEDEVTCDPDLVEIAVPTWTCDKTSDPPFSEESFTIEVPDYLSSSLLQIFEQQKLIAKELCELDPSPPLPQDWIAKRTIVPPQAVVVFRTLGEDSRGYNRISLPWINVATPTSESFIPNYTKGQKYGAIYYKDNSKFIVYCETEEEARRIIDAVIEKIDPTKIDNPPRLSFGERKGYPIRVEGMKAIKQYYYPDGKENGKPAWMRYINENE